MAIGVAVGALIANAMMPSHDQLQDLAEDLVPSGLILTGASVVSGFEPFVGPPTAIAEFDSQGASVQSVADAARRNADNLGWSFVGTEDTSAGEVQRWSLGGTNASIHIRDLEGAEDGAVVVTHRDSPTGRVVWGLLLGAGAGLLAALAFPVVAKPPRGRRPQP
jgi:hypothetical protein